MENTEDKINTISRELYDVISTQFPDINLGDEQALVVTEPADARFFDFTYSNNDIKLGKVSVALDPDSITVIFKKDFASDKPTHIKKAWYNFLRKLRKIANINRLSFDVRDIDKNGLNKRDYQVLSGEKFKGNTMSESKFYGTSHRSYLNIGEARLVIRHNQPIDQEVSGSRAQHVESIYIESTQGERFKYPVKHLNGAKAMAMHVSEGGNQYDDFGKYIVGLSEELASLGKFKRYMNRGGVMAESLAGYVDVVNERVSEIKKTVHKLQRENFYRETFDSFETTILEEVPTDVAENWVDQLTIRQFNEELKGVFPYIYRLVSEATKAKMLSPEDLVAEADDPCWKDYKQIGMKKKGGKSVPNCVPKEELEIEEAFESMMGQFGEAGDNDTSITGSDQDLAMADYGRKVLEGIAKLCRRLEKDHPDTLTQLATDDDLHKSGKIGQYILDKLNLDEDEFSNFEDILDEFGGDPIVYIFAAWKEGQFDEYLDAWKSYTIKVLKKRNDGPIWAKNVGPTMHEAVGDTSTAGYITVRLGKKLTATDKKPYLVAYAGHVTNPTELTYDKAIAKASPITDGNQLRKFISRLLNSETGEPHAVGKPPGVILALQQGEEGGVGIVNAFPFVSEIDDWIKSRNSKNVKIEYFTKDKPIDNKIDIKRPKGDTGGYDPQAVTPAEKVPTTYFKIKNPRLMDHLRKSNSAIIQQNYRPAIKEFVMPQQEFNKFLRMVNSAEYRSNFGDPGIDIDIERSFIESANLEEGFKDKLKVLALLGMAGLGGNAVLDSISAKNSPLGQALAVAAQQGDTEAAAYLEDLDKYVDGNDTRTLYGLRHKYLNKKGNTAEPEFKEDDHGPDCDCQTDECSCGDTDQTMEPPKAQRSMGDFILSFYDRATGNFPKGETSVLTMVEKEFGDQYVPVATEFITKIHGVHEEITGAQRHHNESELTRIRNLAGV